MKSKILILASLMLTIWACTTEPLIPPGYVADPGTGTPTPTPTPTPSNYCDAGVISFQYEILPLVTSGCALAGCHDVTSHKEGVILTNYDNIRKEVRPNNPNSSGLYKYLSAGSGDIMPPSPHAPFSQAQKDLIKNWINQGANNTTCLPECDSTANATFTAVVYPIIENNCVGCHNNSLAQGGVKLNTYASIKTTVDNGKLMGTIEHKPGYSIMPTSGVKLSDCNISLLNQWIASGALND